MSLFLSGDVARRLGHAAEAMLSPLRWPTLDAWWREVESRMQGLVPGSHAMLTIFDGARPRHLSETVLPERHRQLTEFITVNDDGQMAVHCAATDAWLRYRRVTRQQVWGESTNVRDLVHLGFRGIPDCLWYNEGLVPADLKGYVCATTEVDVHEAVLCWSVDRGERWSVQQEEGMALLQVLHPALQAGHRAFATLAARQAAVVASLDAVSEALLVVGPDGRERHRNAALARLLAAEPERERVLAALRDAAGALTAAQAGAGALSLLLPSARTAGERRVVTATARYAVSASYGSEALWGMPGVVVASLTREHVAGAGAPAGVAEPADELPASALSTLGFTAREGEVARLLARRMTNAELAATLGVSAHTARHHTERVMQKLGVRSRRAIVSALLARAPG